MELFNVYNDLIFRSVPFIVDKLINDESIGNEKTMRKIFLDANELTEEGNKTKLTNGEYISDVLMLNDKIDKIDNDYFLTKYHGEIKLNTQNVSVSKALPIVFSSHEREYIRLMLEDPEARCFMDKELAEKLQSYLTNYDISYIKDNYIEREAVVRNVDEDKLRPVLTVIIKALVKGKKIKYKYIDGKGDVRTGKVSPFRLMYSLRERILQLAACPDSCKNRYILMNIERFESVELTNENSEAYPDDFYLSQKRKLILMVENDHKDQVKRKKTIERCVMVFSSYERSSKFVEDSSYFCMEIEFYRFDKEKIINDILSLGSSVEVQEVLKLDESGKNYIKDDELDIRKEVIGRLRKMYDAMQ